MSNIKNEIDNHTFFNIFCLLLSLVILGAYIVEVVYVINKIKWKYFEVNAKMLVTCYLFCFSCRATLEIVASILENDLKSQSYT